MKNNCQDDHNGVHLFIMAFGPISKLMNLKFLTASYTRGYQETHTVAVSPSNQFQFTSMFLQKTFRRARGFPHLLYGLKGFSEDSDTKPFLRSRNVYQVAYFRNFGNICREKPGKGLVPELLGEKFIVL